MSPNDEQRPDEFPADLKPIEAALAGLSPAAVRLDRDRLMYMAGAAAAEAAAQRTGPAASNRLFKTWIWPLSTAVLLLVSFGLGAMLAFREPGERVVYVEQ